MNHYSKLAKLFLYPATDNHVADVKELQEILDDKFPKAGQELQRFTDWVLSTPMHDQEELFTKTFHIQAICYLDLGYVLFGEDYKRGDFLANMCVEQAKAGIDLESELADNLVNVLKLISVHEDREFVEELSSRIVMPSLKKMLIEFDSKLMENRLKYIKKKEKAVILENIQNGNIYQNALNALLLVFDQEFGHIKFEEMVQVPEFSKDFVGDCSTCAPKLNFNEIRKS